MNILPFFIDTILKSRFMWEFKTSYKLTSFKIFYFIPSILDLLKSKSKFRPPFSSGVLEISCQSDKIISRIDNGTTNRFWLQWSFRTI